MDLLATNITTRRLALIPWSSEHVADMFREFTNEVTTYMGPQPCAKIEQTVELVRNAREAMRAGKQLYLTIIDRETGEFLGSAGLHDIGQPQPEFGVWLKISAHGHAYGREAVHGLKLWADATIDCESYIYPVDERNTPSRKIAESLGGSIIKRYTETNSSGSLLQIVVYEVPREQGL